MLILIAPRFKIHIFVYIIMNEKIYILLPSETDEMYLSQYE